MSKQVMSTMMWLVLCTTAVAFCTGSLAANIEEVQAKPLKDLIKPALKPITNENAIPMILWGADVAQVMGDTDGIFKADGLSPKFFVENDFLKQTQACMDGKTPYLRGTMGMISSAAELFKAAGTELVVIYQLSWSVGGDAIVVRDNIKTPKDLEGKTIAVQLFGPHMDLATNVLRASGVDPSKVKFKWFKELTIPTFDTNGKIIDPMQAFAADAGISAATCIYPDAMTLTSGGKIGTGSDNSVKGAWMMMSTQTASRIIADVYAVRKDYLDANRSKVQAFVHALMRSQDAFLALLADKKNQQAKYQQVLAKSADILLGAPQATNDIDGLVTSCELVGLDGNIAFFTGKGTTRSLATLSDEIQASFSVLGLISSKTTIASANWDYTALQQGVKSSGGAGAAPKYDQTKVAQAVETMITAEADSWADKGTLFEVEIYFDPEQSTFTVEKYAADYQKALEIAQTYSGALVIIEGHADPLGILKAKQKGVGQAEIAAMEQKVKNLSLQRSQAVRDSFLGYCKDKDIQIDPTQFHAVGLGISMPKFNPPRTKEEWNQNRRVVFRIKQVEAESSMFEPLGN